MAKILSKEQEERADRDIKRLKKMSLPEAILQTIRVSQKDLKGFPARRKELAKMLVVNLAETVRTHPSALDPTEQLIMVLSFMALYGRLPKKRELVDLDIGAIMEYFTKKYPEDILGE